MNCAVQVFNRKDILRKLVELYPMVETDNLDYKTYDVPLGFYNFFLKTQTNSLEMNVTNQEHAEYLLLSYNICWEAMAGNSSHALGRKCGKTKINYCRQNVIDVCIHTRYDFYGLQETSSELVNEIVNKLNRTNNEYESIIRPSEQSISKAVIIYKSSRFDPIGYPVHGTIYNVHGRRYIAQHFYDKYSQASVYVISLHGPHSDWNVAKSINNILEDLQADLLDIRLIVLGDFNKSVKSTVILNKDFRLAPLNPNTLTCCNNGRNNYSFIFDNILISLNLTDDCHAEFFPTSTGNFLLPNNFQPEFRYSNNSSDHSPIAAKITYRNNISNLFNNPCTNIQPKSNLSIFMDELKNNQIKLVVFDFDGVIVPVSEYDHATGYYGCDWNGHTYPHDLDYNKTNCKEKHPVTNGFLALAMALLQNDIPMVIVTSNHTKNIQYVFKEGQPPAQKDILTEMNKSNLFLKALLGKDSGIPTERSQKNNKIMCMRQWINENPDKNIKIENILLIDDLDKNRKAWREWGGYTLGTNRCTGITDIFGQLTKDKILRQIFNSDWLEQIKKMEPAMKK